MKCSLVLLLLVSTLSATTFIQLGLLPPCTDGIWADVTPIEGGTIVIVEDFYPDRMPDPMPTPMPDPMPWPTHSCTITAYPNDGYVFSHWLQDGNEIIGFPTLFITYTKGLNENCIAIVQPPATTFSAVFNIIDQAPVLDLETFYESNSGESITIDATPTGGYPPEYFYQWYYNESPIQSQFGGTGMTFTIDGASSSNATWRVEVTNEVGTTSAEFEYRVFTDADSDGLSDYREDNILDTDPNLADSDSDGLNDYEEVNTHSTNPLLADTDTDGLSDGAEVNTYSSDPLDSDSDDDGLNDYEEIQGTSIYQIVSEYLSWHDARDSAIERGGHLAVVSNQQEWNKIYQLISNTSPEGYWLGATDEATEGIWEWVNGEDWSFTNWHLGEPNNETLSYKPNGEDYLSTWASDNHEWNDSDDEASSSKEYIIEYQINQTDPNNPDSDGDGLSDGSEVTTHQTNPNLSDTDSDQLSDYSEINSHLTDPNDPDSDDDGLSDGNEVNTYTTNPLAADTTGDGFSDGFVVTQGADPLFDYSAFRIETVNQIKDARVGSTIIEVSNGKADIIMTLEETSNLSDWSNAGTSEQTIEVDAPSGIRFYRFKMSE